MPASCETRAPSPFAPLLPSSAQMSPAFELWWLWHVQMSDRELMNPAPSFYFCYSTGAGVFSQVRFLNKWSSAFFFRPQRKLSKGFGIGEEWIDEPSDVPCRSADSDSARPAGEVAAEPETLHTECSVPPSPNSNQRASSKSARANLACWSMPRETRLPYGSIAYLETVRHKDDWGAVENQSHRQAGSPFV